jgi:hypothetical protein
MGGPTAIFIRKSPLFLIEFYIYAVRISVSKRTCRRYMCFFYILSYIAFFSCIGLTILKDLKRATKDVCNPHNFLPTLSSSIACCYPQSFIWHFYFGLSSFPRYCFCYMQMKQRLSRTYMALPKYYALAEQTNGFVHFLELTCLLILSYISSYEMLWVHVYSYLGFVIFSLLHMLFTIGIDYMWPRTIYGRLTELEKDLRAKRLRWFVINASSFFISVYFYFRHIMFCEPFIYSIHSLLEYSVILTNIAYHGVAFEEWNLPEQTPIYY